jgi:hypothetical protein
MPTRRTPIQRRHRNILISDPAIAAYVAGDYHALHRALRLRPWQASPLPQAVMPLGVSEDPPDWVREDPRELQRWNEALEIQREIKKVIKLRRRP